MASFASVFLRLHPDGSALGPETRKVVKDQTRNLPPVKVPLDADDAKAKAKVAKFSADLAKLGSKVTTARMQLAGDVQAQAALARLQVNLATLGKGDHTAKVKLDGGAKIESQLLGLEAQFARVGERTKTVRSETDSLGRSLIKTASSFAGASDAASLFSRDTGIAAKAMAGLSLATGVLLPVVAGLIVTAGGLGAAFAGTAVAAGIFGKVASGVFKEASDAAQKYQAAQLAASKATTAAAKASAAAAKKQAFEGLSKPIRTLAISIIGVQDEWKRFLNQVSPGVVGVAEKAIGLIPKALELIKPTLGPVEVALRRVLDLIDKGLNNPAFGAGLTRFAKAGAQEIVPLAHIVGNLAHGFAGLAIAFEPAGRKIIGGLERLTASFARWGSTVSTHSGFQSLIQEAQQYAPPILAALRNIADAIVHVVSDLAGSQSLVPFYARVLPPLTHFLDVLITAHPALVQFAFYALAGASALNKVGRGISGLVLGFAGIGKAGSLFAGLAGKIGLVATAERGAAAAAGEAAIATKGAAVAAGEASVASKGFLAGLAGLLGPLGAVALAVGAVALATHGFKGTEDTLGQSIDRQVKAAGYSVSAYQQLAKQTDVLSGGSARVHQAMATVAQGFGDTGVAAAAASVKEQFLIKVHAAMLEAASNLSGRMATLQGQFGLTSAGAAQLAAKAGVTAQQLAASGASGQGAYRKIVTYANGVGQATVESIRLATASDRVKSALDKVSGGILGNQQALVTWRQAQQSALQAINASNTGLKGQSAAALQAKQAVIQSTGAAIDLANAEAKQKGGMDRATGTIRDQIKWLQQHGDHSIFARREVEALREALATLKSKHIDIAVSGNGHWTVMRAGSGPGIRGGAATGGHIRGPGGPTEDKAGLYALSNDEWVIRAHAATGYGDRAMAAVNRGQATILYPGMAEGGAVGGTYTGTPSGAGRFGQSKYKQTVQIVEAATAAATAAGIKSAQLAANARGFGVGKGGNQGLARYAASYGTGLNHPYVWGGNTPAGWDCSGFSKWCYNHYGYSPPRTSQTQQLWARPSGDIPGALVFFYGSGGTASHVGISLGHGNYVGADNPGVGTVIHSSAGNSGFGIPPGGFAAGGKVGGGKGKKPVDPQQRHWLSVLAHDVTKLRGDEKHAVARRKVLRRSLDISQLWFLRHPKAKPGTIDFNEHQKSLRHARAALAGFNRREAAVEGRLRREIALLRRLTGEPVGKRYGGPGKGPGPGQDPGGGDGGGGGDIGGGGGDTGGGGTGPVQMAGPIPAWLLPYAQGGINPEGDQVVVGASPGGTPGMGGGFAWAGTGAAHSGSWGGMGGGGVEGLLQELVEHARTGNQIARGAPAAAGVAFGQGVRGLGRDAALFAGKAPR